MGFDVDDLIALYLLEHPNDEDGVQTVTIDGTDMQAFTREVMLRFARWGVESGYFGPERVREFIPWVQQLKVEKDVNGGDHSEG